MADFWNYEFLRNTLLAAMLLGPTCALLGVFVTLRGMAFFSDALAHSALTGVALGYLFQEIFDLQIPLLLVVLLFSFGLATLMAYFFEKTLLRADTIIAFSFTGSVALGVVIISALGKYRLIDGLLFGSIHANTRMDLVLQALFCVGLIAFLLAHVKPYALTILQPDLARAQGIKMERLNYFFALAIAATVAMGMKMVGALLLSALIVIPPAAAKLISGNFRSMLWIAPLLGLLAAIAGVVASNQISTPTGPTIVLTHVAILLVCIFYSQIKKSHAVPSNPLPN
jgi:zinc transport system permease protein